MKTLVVGLGNPILGDDGVGWKVAEEVRRQLPSLRLRRLAPQAAAPMLAGAGVWEDPEGDDVDVEFLSVGGISLMERLIGYERAILVDAVESDQEIGSLIVSDLNEMPDYSAFHIASAHDTSLQNALKLGRAMGASLPEVVTVVGIATGRIFDFSEELSMPVAGAVSKAAGIVIELLYKRS